MTAASAERLRARRGMTLVELMVAVLLLSIGLLGLAGFSYAMTQQQKSSLRQQRAALVAQSRLDSLSSVSCQLLAPGGMQTGSAVTQGVSERWVIVDGNDIKSITDTVRFAGRTNPLVYKSIIPCRD